MSVTRNQDRQDRPDRGTIDAARTRHDRYADVPTCAGCGHWMNPDKDFRGSYCSPDCYYRHNGHKALKNIEKDHRYCRSCFAKCKQVEAPDDDGDYPECVVGYQYGTPDATTASRDYDRDDDPRPLVRQRIGCVCGATDLRYFDETLATIELARTLENLVDALREKEREDKVPTLDHRRLFEAYRETENLEYAVGVGLYE